jgi:pimeloyl-ACP methyl ester carboxylesterase
MKGMTDFLLIHGSGQNAASWQRLCEILLARGHTVTTPELPKQAADWTLQDYVDFIGESQAPAGAIAVAHSLSGVFLPLLPRVCECSLLVFLAAVIPAPGRSVREQFAADPTMFAPDWIAAGQRWLDPVEAQRLSRDFLFHDCDEETTAWALTTVEPYDSRRLVTEPCPVADWPAVPAASIVASRDRTLDPGWCRRMTRETLGCEPIDIDSGHCPQISQPVALADRLQALARRRETS